VDASLKDRALASYPAAVVRRFFELELLDRCFGLAAQAFVSMLPLLIVVVSLFMGGKQDLLATSMNERFGLVGAAELAVRALFQAPAEIVTISWLAVTMSLLSAFALSRRLSRVYGSIFGLPSMARSEVWRGLVWIGLQLILFAAASQLRGVRRDSGVILAAVAIVVLLAVWFLGDMAGLRLLVPSIPRSVLVPSAILTGVGRVGLAAWGAIYMPRSLSEQADQFGPIGVTFALFTYILAGVFVYTGGPLLASVWLRRRSGERDEASSAEASTPE
jgi:membrane protein